MTWTYSGDPGSTSRDEVRFLIGDTDNGDQIVSDEEIAYAIAQEGNNRLAAIRVIRATAGKYARKVDKAVGDLKMSYGQIAKHYMDLAVFLESSDDNLYAPMAYAGGITHSGKDSVKADTDRVDPSFTKGVHDNPENNNDDRESPE